MSDKKNALDIFGGTTLPSDLGTHSLGSGFGVGEYPDMSYDMGNLERVENPDLPPSPALPTGLARGAAEDMDLSQMLNEDLTDLDWLDPTQIQDPERLPEQTVDTMIPELVEAWGVNRRTNGIEVVSRDLNQARYEESLQKESSDKKATARQMFKVVAQAMRRSASGQDINVVLKEAYDAMGEEGDRIVPHLRAVKADHGLAGNVFIRAAAYPGYESGKWGKKLQKTGARYVIVTEKQLKQATWIVDGRCTYTGKVAVTQVPWQEAFDHYASKNLRFRQAGQVKFPRESLQLGFLRVPEKKAVDSGYLPTHDPLLREDPRREASELRSPQQKRVARGVAKVSKRIREGLQGDLLKGLIRQTFMEKDLRLATKMLTPILKETQALNPARKQAVYQGAEFHAAATAAPAKKAGRIASEVRGALKWVRRAMSEGFAGKDLDDLIANRFTDRVRLAAEDGIGKLREAHEGGAGFLWVDAEAYASQAGVKGCKEGALKHRANQIKTVAAMDRCATCTLARTLEDGTRKCSAYNKMLLEDIGGPEMQRLREANIQVSHMNDHEHTASLFAAPKNAYDPGEFNLHNANLEGIAPGFAENEKVAEFVFGDWDL